MGSRRGAQGAVGTGGGRRGRWAQGTGDQRSPGGLGLAAAATPTSSINSQAPLFRPPCKWRWLALG